jgi:hypothetical protein
MVKSGIVTATLRSARNYNSARVHGMASPVGPQVKFPGASAVAAKAPLFAPKALIQERGVLLDPAPEGEVIDGQKSTPALYVAMLIRVMLCC